MIQTSRLRLTSSSMGLILIYIFLILPLATPFVSGTTTPSSSLRTNVALPSSQSTTTRQQPPSPPSVPLRRDQRPFSSPPLSESINGAVSPLERKQQKRIRRWRFFPWRSQNKNDDADDQADTTTSRATVESSSIFSRLIFAYAVPLLKAASTRHLQVDDAYELDEAKKMESSVTRLASIHKQLRQEAQADRHDMEQEQYREDLVSTQASLLLKALFLQQRRMLILTGVLRLANTALQAFPALLVARLLRLAEAGSSVPASKTVQAALALVSVLSLKMIIENHYFYNAFSCATNVRGSLSGLIFDKALALPGGGSGVVHPTDSTMNGKQKKKKKKKKNGSETQQNAGQPAAIGSGGVLNLMQSDTGIIEQAALQIHILWDGILQLIVYTTLLYRFLGPSVIYGCIVLVATIPINSIALRILNRLTKYENQAKDARTKRTVESITNMKLLKLYGWEQSFADDIRGHRKEELRRHVSRGIVRAINSAISNAVPALVLVVTLRAYARSGATIAASTIFTAISLFNQLRFPLFFYPMLIDSLANGRNALRRIANFVATEETVPYVQHLPPVVTPDQGTGGLIEMKHGNFLWSVSQIDRRMNDEEEEEEENNSESNGSTLNWDDPAPVLADVNLTVNPGEIVAVVGSVGSGKSGLVKALLGELNPVPRPLMEQALSRGAADQSTVAMSPLPMSSVEQSPSVAIHGEIAYCSQEAWLPKGTIRDAITFGRDFDEARYFSAVRDAGLDKDIVDDLGTEADPKKGQLSHETDVGEHGSSLSGGQRARVALARALYSDEATTKVFLLDDCLGEFAFSRIYHLTLFSSTNRRNLSFAPHTE